MTLKIANHPFGMRHWLMMMHHNTKFGSKILVSLEDTIGTNTDILTLCCDLDLENSKPTCLQDTLAHDYNTKFGNKMFVGLEDIIWTNIDILTF